MSTPTEIGQRPMKTTVAFSTVDVVTSDLLREMSESVQPGEAITFPNGITIDKRPLAFPAWWPVPPQSWNQWQAGPHATH